MLEANSPDAGTAESPADARHRVMQDSSHHFLGLLDLGGTVLEVNQRVGALHGLHRDGLVGYPIWASPFWEHGDRVRLQQAVDQAGAGGCVRHEIHVVETGGERLTIDFSVGPVRDEQGVIVYLIAEGHDRTELHRLEAALEQQRAFLQAVLDNVADGIAACNAEGVLTLFNPAARAFHNLREFPIPAADWAEHYDLYQPDALTPLKAEDVPLYRAFRGQMVQNVEMVIAPKGGKKRHLLASGQRLVHPDGTLLGAVVAMNDVTDLKETEAQLNYAVQHDGLTGLPGAQLYNTRLEQATRRAESDPEFRFAVLYIDLDGFKTVNDTLGHSIGDNLLVTVARQLERCVRGDDIVARLGGDEFAVLFAPLVHPEDAAKLAERVLQDLAISLNVGGREVSVSVSIGVALSGEKRHARDLLAAADVAMYQAKAAGKAQYVLSRKPSR